MLNISRGRCDGLERQPVQNVVLLQFIIGLCVLRKTRICQRLAHTCWNVYPVQMSSHMDHLVLRDVYVHVCQRLTFYLTSLNTATVPTTHIIVCVNDVLMRLLSCNVCTCLLDRIYVPDRHTGNQHNYVVRRRRLSRSSARPPHNIWLHFVQQNMIGMAS